MGFLQKFNNNIYFVNSGDSLLVSLIEQRAIEFPEQMVLNIAKQSPV